MLFLQKSCINMVSSWWFMDKQSKTYASAGVYFKELALGGVFA